MHLERYGQHYESPSKRFAYHCTHECATKIQNNDSIAILISELKATFFIFATMSNCTVNKNNIYAN